MLGRGKNKPWCHLQILGESLYKEMPVKSQRLGARKMVQSVKCLVGLHRDLTLYPQHPSKKLGMVVYSYDPSAVGRGAETRGSLVVSGQLIGNLAKSSSMFQVRAPHSVGDPAFCGERLREASNSSLKHSPTRARECTCTLTVTRTRDVHVHVHACTQAPDI